MNSTSENFDKEFNKIYNYSLNVLTAGPKTKNQLLKKIQYKFNIIDENVISSVTDRLEEIGLLDDALYIQAYVDSIKNSSNKNYGISLIKQKLIQRGITKSQLDEYFKENNFDDAETIRKAISKKYPSLKNLPKDKQKQRLLSFLGSKGFTMSLIYAEVDTFLKLK